VNDVIVNADDLGMTPGTNAAIFDAYDSGILTHVSIMANGACFEEAVEGLLKRPGLKCGVHLNLSYGKSLLFHPLLCDGDGFFKYGFAALMFRVAGSREMLDAIGDEMEAQIRKVVESGVVISHLDSHRHVHLIPPIYAKTVALARAFGIDRIRLVKESIVDSVRIGGIGGIFFNGGVVKYALLGMFSYFDRRHTDMYDRSFYSILHTGGVTKEALEKILQSKKAYEVMVHPGYPDMDEKTEMPDVAEKRYRVSPHRRRELEALLKAALKKESE